MLQKRWNILAVDERKLNHLHENLKINRGLCSVLVHRGIDDFELAKQFFRPKFSDLHDPWLMKDMNKGIDRILQAINLSQKILILGDYDVDGTTAVACVYSFLRKVYDKQKLDFYIPHRYSEGYGISKAGIDFAKKNDFSLIIALDCGIKSIELISYAKGLGVDFIVCDHHLPDDELPEAIAILNPKQIKCEYPYKELCGCGIAFKLITALSQKLELNQDSYFVYVDLVATAIAADIVPITGENRVLAWYGLKKINSDPGAGIKALKLTCNPCKKDFNFKDVLFLMAPRINAAGRMDNARKAVCMFVEENPEKALAYAEELQADNALRKNADLLITKEALAILEGNDLLTGKKTTVVFKKDWHKGVVGIVASRLMETYYRPTVVLTQHENVVTGSARSVNGFNLYEAIFACRQHLIVFGGHSAAAGLSMLPTKVDSFSEDFELAVAALIKPHQLIPEILIDTEMSFKSISKSLYQIIYQMEPFGPGNSTPIFMASNVYDTGYSKIIKDRHLKFVLKQDNVVMSGVGFNMAEKFSLLHMNHPLDIVFNVDLNEWQGETNIQLKIIDFKLSEA